MNEIAYIVIVLFVAIGILVGTAYLLQKRSDQNSKIEFPSPKSQRVTKFLNWYLRGFVLLLVVLVILGAIFWNVAFIWIALGVMILQFAIGLISILFF